MLSRERCATWLGAGVHQATDLQISSDGKAVTVANLWGEVRLVDLAKGAEEVAIGGHRNHVGMMTFAPDGAQITTSARGEIICWNLQTGKELKRQNDSEFVCQRYRPGWAKVSVVQRYGAASASCA